MISKSDESIVPGDWCYTKFQTLLTNTQHTTVTQFLDEIINSNHHFWQGDKYEGGMTWTHSHEKEQALEYKGVKTFGFYNNDDIRPSDYKVIDYDSFENRLMSFIIQETDDKDYEMKIKTLIQSYKNQSLTFFQFLPEKLERSKFSVYSSFIAFVLVDKELKKATRIEFGQD